MSTTVAPGESFLMKLIQEAVERRPIGLAPPGRMGTHQPHPSGHRIPGRGDLIRSGGTQGWLAFPRRDAPLPALTRNGPHAHRPAPKPSSSQAADLARTVTRLRPWKTDRRWSARTGPPSRRPGIRWPITCTAVSTTSPPRRPSPCSTGPWLASRSSTRWIGGCGGRSTGSPDPDRLSTLSPLMV